MNLKEWKKFCRSFIDTCFSKRPPKIAAGIPYSVCLDRLCLRGHSACREGLRFYVFDEEPVKKEFCGEFVQAAVVSVGVIVFVDSYEVAGVIPAFAYVNTA